MTRGGRYLTGAAAPSDIQISSTAIIGIVGAGKPVAMASHTPNVPVLLLNNQSYLDLIEADDNLKLAKELGLIYAICGENSVPPVVMVNVFDPAGAHKTAMESTLKSLTTVTAETIGALTNVTGVVLKGVQGAGSFTLDYKYNGGTGKTLSWGGGTPVDVDAGGAFELTASTGQKITATVTPGSLPAEDKADAAIVVVAGVYKANAGHEMISGVEVKDAAGAQTRTVTTDYTVDADTGLITILRSADIAAASVKIACNYGDYAKIAAADIVGEQTLTGKTGLMALLDAKPVTGYEPKIVGAPYWSHEPTVRARMESVNDSLNAIGYFDFPTGTSVTAAIAARETPGNVANTSSKLVTPCFPGLIEDTDEDMTPASLFAMALRAKVDLEEDYWVSISSHQIPEAIKGELAVGYGLMKSTAEANLLNEAGILTLKNVGGLKFHGNYNASYPTNTTVDKFEVAVRIAFVIEESIAAYMESELDKPLYAGPNDPALPAQVADNVTRLLGRMKAAGAILGGRCWYTAADNPAESIQAGDFSWQFDFADNVPLNSFAFRSSRNTDYYNSLTAEE